MDKTTKEDIDRIISESVLETGSDKILLKFSKNLNEFLTLLEESEENLDDRIAIFLSCIMTAQVNAVNIMRDVLYKIVCKNEEETKHTTNGGSEHAQDQ